MLQMHYYIEQSGYGKKIPAGIVLTGGTSYLQYILDLAKALLNRKIRLAAPISIDVNSLEASFDTFSSTTAGLLCEGFEPILSSKTEKYVQETFIVTEEDYPVDQEDFDNCQSKENEEEPQEKNISSNKKTGLFSGLFSKKKHSDENSEIFNEQETYFDETEEIVPETPIEKTIDNSKPKKSKPKSAQSQEKDSNWGLFKDLFTDNNEA